MWLDSAIIIGERLLTTDVAREDLAYRQDVLEMLINACRQHRDDELAIHWLAQMIDLCHQNGDETEALRTEADLGLILSGIGHADKGLAKIDSVLTLLSGKRQFNELDATIIALKRKVNVLKNMQNQEPYPNPSSPTPNPSSGGEGLGVGLPRVSLQALPMPTFSSTCDRSLPRNNSSSPRSSTVRLLSTVSACRRSASAPPSEKATSSAASPPSSATAVCATPTSCSSNTPK
jgi:hypothetical protein